MIRKKEKEYGDAEKTPRKISDGSSCHGRHDLRFPGNDDQRGRDFFIPVTREMGQPTAAVSLTLAICNITFAVAGVFFSKMG